MYKIQAELKNNISQITIYKENNRTTALCTVEGPFHLQTKNEDFKSLIVDVKCRGGDDKYIIKSMIKSILEHFIILELDSCKSICISLYITGSSKFTLISGINAALLGLINTGIPLKKMFYGIQDGDRVYIYDGNEIVFEHFLETRNVEGGLKDQIFKYTKEVINFSISQQHIA